MMTKQDITDLIEALKRERDALRVQLHLFKQEARSEWETLEKKWEHLQQRSAIVREAAGEVASELGTAVRLLGQEIRDGYRKLRETLKST